jgi:hypothetical protein
MSLYSVRKRRGQWTVCLEESVVMNFETYDDAVGTARSAVGVLFNSRPGIRSGGAFRRITLKEFSALQTLKMPLAKIKY